MNQLLAQGLVLLPVFFMLILAVASIVLLLTTNRQSDRLTLRGRLARGEIAAQVATRKRRRMLGMIGDLGSRFAGSGLLSARTVRELEQTLASAGIVSSRALGFFIASKVIAALALPALAALLVPRLPVPGIVRICLVLASFVIGLLLPDYFIRRRRNAYVRTLEAGLGDALDMMVICAEAGLATEPALLRVSNELAPVHPALADELMRTVQELQMMSESRIALQNMGTRSGVSGLKRLAATMIQSLHHGTPLIQALRTLSVEMRGEMLLRFEERAARLPTLLTIPMIVFILPCVFLIVGGPAMIQVLQHFHH
ncbi:type II secretion system F family protein [Lichenicola cladoniae]|uniref:Type II secretion system F family protein n=1 Tax=Lichenicola cladoniae TaxID=1484109 RepID=A0A6M8HM52_9PROT|nr:type II secretion system F family protein [Lichenicola cladoniae]NPD69963.1 type II secretion system F family protein [Acetobacteraceae bacterium]QKE89381.1 type II secretion system F family protein [Lichenicola cladoniae]